MRIIAYPFHEQERSLLDVAVADKEDESEDYVIGSIDEAGIDRLEVAGIIFDLLPEDDGVRSARPIDPQPTAVGSPVDDQVRRYIIRLDGPLLPSNSSALEFDGAQLLERVPRSPYDVISRMTPTQAESVAGLDFVFDVAPYDWGPDEVGGAIRGLPDDGDFRSARDLDPVATSTPEQREMLTFDVVAVTAADVGAVAAWLEGHQAAILGTGERKIRIVVRDDSTVPDEVRTLVEVEDVYPYVPPKLHMDRARHLVGIEDPVGGQRVITQTGAGQVIGVADTGIDAEHPDLQPPRLGPVFALGRPSDSSDPNGHGTHVAGIAAGDGSASNGDLAGAAPEATVVFQSLLDSAGGLGGLPIDLATLFQQAFDAGVRIHNNSWGSTVTSEYVLSSHEVDEFVAAHREMLIVISAGNEGQAAHRVSSGPGVVDLTSITAPASAKNALTVGASRSDRQSGGFSEMTYGQAWPANYPDPPIAQQMISGDASGLAAFSSRGPSLPTRIKPDLVAPGTDIAASKSSSAPLTHFWGPVANTTSYAYMGGTSMSAPLVAGCAALVREYYVVDHGHEPSAALLKATLINGTRSLGAADSMALHPALPNYNQGFGCVDMPSTIPNSSRPLLALDFADAASDELETGDRFFRDVDVDPGADLRVCLCWTDFPGRSLVNNLNLVVMEPGGRKHIGNPSLPVSFTRLDTENNVEVVQIASAAAGKYTIVVIGQNILKPPQDFALVMTGNLA